MGSRNIRLLLVGLLLTAVTVLLLVQKRPDRKPLPPELTPPAELSQQAIADALQQAADLQRMGRISDARHLLEQTVQDSPGNAASRRQLIRLLSGFGLRFQAFQHLQVLLEKQQTQPSDLLQLASNGRALAGRLQLERAYQLQPQDPLPVIGLLHTAVAERDAADFQRLMQEAAATFQQPPLELMRLQLLGELLMPLPPLTDVDANADADQQAASISQFARLQQLVQHVPEHPETWLLAAEWARQQNREAEHRDCLWKALQQDPWNTSAVSALASFLAVADPETALQLRQLEQRLQSIQQAAAMISRAPSDTSALRTITMELTAIGRHAEALAWARAALAYNAEMAWAAEYVMSDEPVTSWSHPAFARPSKQPVLAVVPASTQTTAEASFADLYLQNVAEEFGLNFIYRNGLEPTDRGLKMHEWTGGGVAVLDFDNDSWPDLYFPQGGILKLPDESSTDANESSQHISTTRSSQDMSDQLFRNYRATGVTAVTQAAGISETRFGQGVAAGDINHDGFTDLYVANIGTNRILTNMGDGTFVAADAPAGEFAWTSSVAIADIDSDGHPDLYDVNYLTGPEVFTQTCDHSGHQRICGPTAFAAANDRVLLSDGQGSFSEWTGPREFPADARGLGIVVADFTGAGRNQIYIANDEGANQLLTPDSGSAEQPLQLRDSAFTAGVASDYYGQLQGSMGIAVADIDGNGWPDIFVTNYYAEANTLYAQQDPHLFVDVTSACGLAVPSYSQLGFGCQFLDVDADGDADLVVLNGHLDDFTFKGHPWHMQPQLFMNSGDGSFQEARPAGGYFQTAALGRALATLDWNRDGACDLVATHLDQPAALIVNQTPQATRATRIRLIGVHCPRRPVSAVVSATEQSLRQRQWLTAGDGYQCSNQPELRLVLPGTEPCVVTINWPDSTTQNITVTPGSSVTVIQGQSVAWLIPE